MGVVRCVTLNKYHAGSTHFIDQHRTVTAGHRVLTKMVRTMDFLYIQ